MDDDDFLRLIEARCPELSELELDQIEAALANRLWIVLDGDVAEKLMAVIDVIQQRLDELTAALAERAIAQEIEASFIDSAAEVLH